MIFNILKYNTKLIFVILFSLLGISERVASMSIESLQTLENIRSAKLNTFNLKKIIQEEKLQNTRIEYERALTQGRQAMLDKYGVSIQEKKINGINAYEYIPQKIYSEKVALHVHGGAFVLLSAASSYNIPIQISSICGIKIISIDYGLAPENKYSHMVSQTESAIKGILSTGCAAKDLILLGESAGGALCVSAAYELAKKGLEIGQMILLSPWVDILCDVISDHVDDPVLRKKDYLEIASSLVIEDKENEKLLPFSLEYSSCQFPKTLIQYGTNEILADQTELFCKLLKENAISVEIESYKKLWHVFQSYADLPETRRAMESIKRFVSNI